MSNFLHSLDTRNFVRKQCSHLRTRNQPSISVGQMRIISLRRRVSERLINLVSSESFDKRINRIGLRLIIFSSTYFDIARIRDELTNHLSRSKEERTIWNGKRKSVLLIRCDFGVQRSEKSLSFNHRLFISNDWELRRSVGTITV